MLAFPFVDDEGFAKWTQGVKKVSFTACHLGKLYLACISLRVSLTALKKVFDDTVLLQFELPKKLYLPSG